MTTITPVSVEEALKPCPFCNVRLERHSGGGSGWWWTHPKAAYCPAQSVTLFNDDADRITAWNTRAPHQIEAQGSEPQKLAFNPFGTGLSEPRLTAEQVNAAFTRPDPSLGSREPNARSLIVTFNDSGEVVSVDHKMGPDAWVKARRGIEAAYAELGRMLSKQDECPAKPSSLGMEGVREIDADGLGRAVERLNAVAASMDRLGETQRASDIRIVLASITPSGKVG